MNLSKSSDRRKKITRVEQHGGCENYTVSSKQCPMNSYSIYDMLSMNVYD